MAHHAGVGQDRHKAWLAWAFLGVVFLIGGGSRSDIPYLIVLRPAAVLITAYAVLRLSMAEVRDNWVILAFPMTGMILTLIHLVPLPPAIWTALPGREILSDIDRAAGFDGVWRPLSFSPSDSWNAFYAMFVPLGVLLTVLRLDTRWQPTILRIMIGAAIVSGLVGMLQVLGGRNAFNIYGLGGEVDASGLFTNRNHAAVYLACLPPMLAAWSVITPGTAEGGLFRRLAALAIALTTIPLVLVIGSRAGLIAELIGITAAMTLYASSSSQRVQQGKPNHRNGLWYSLAAAGAIVMAVVTIVMSRGEAFERMSDVSNNEIRFRMWGPIADIGTKHLPFGSGIGSFERVYQIYEPLSQLRSTYANHAHNDWLEIYMTAGIPGMFLLGFLVIGWTVMTWNVWFNQRAINSEAILGRLASVLIFILGIASLSDYPLRVPSLASVAAIAAIWLHHGGKTVGERAQPRMKRGAPGSGSANEYVNE